MIIAYAVGNSEIAPLTNKTASLKDEIAPLKNHVVDWNAGRMTTEILENNRKTNFNVKYAY